jgi:hypothetical protein
MQYDLSDFVGALQAKIPDVPHESNRKWPRHLLKREASATTGHYTWQDTEDYGKLLDYSLQIDFTNRETGNKLKKFSALFGGRGIDEARQYEVAIYFSNGPEKQPSQVSQIVARDLRPQGLNYTYLRQLLASRIPIVTPNLREAPAWDIDLLGGSIISEPGKHDQVFGYDTHRITFNDKAIQFSSSYHINDDPTKPYAESDRFKRAMEIDRRYDASIGAFRQTLLGSPYAKKLQSDRTISLEEFEAVIDSIMLLIPTGAPKGH